MAEPELSFLARLWLALVCLFRVVFDPPFAALVAQARDQKALPAPAAPPGGEGGFGEVLPPGSRTGRAGPRPRGGGASVTARYSVGIDLGTTNGGMAEVDLAVEPAGPGEPLPAPLTVEVPQVVSPGETGPRELLPSFVYLPSPHEAQKGAFALPWGDPGYLVGAYARDRGAQVPGRLVSSAKSWLSHPGVDKRGQLLPMGAEAEVPRISPVEASARIVSHLRAAWDAAHEDEKLADQAVTLTVPASFDAVARELTVQAAAQAGLAELTPLQETPAAA